MKCLLGVALAFGLAMPAAAEMSVGTFLAKADALQKRGMTAIFSTDLKLVKGEMTRAVEAFEADTKAAKAAGRQPPACVPAKTKLNSDELMSHFRTIPVAQAGKVSVKSALYGYLKRKYPCPTG